MKLSTKLMAAMAGLTVVTAAAVGTLVYRNLSSALLDRQSRIAQLESRALGRRLNEHAEGARADIEAFRHAPALEGLIRARHAGGVDPESGAQEAFWQKALAGLFRASMEAHSEYLQLRLIGIADNGFEIVRVDRPKAGASVRIVPESELQPKGNRPYFRDAIELPGEAIYTSPIELNREHGEIQRPETPVTRVASPVFGPEGQAFGIVVINIDMRPVFADLRESLTPGAILYLANEQGEYLLHPDASQAFAFETGGKVRRWPSEFPELAARLGDSESATARAVKDSESAKHLAAVRLRLNEGPELVLIQAIPEDLMLAPLAAVSRTVLFVGVAVTILAIGLALLMGRTVARPIERLAAGVAGFQGEGAVRIDIPDGGEIGRLARKFEEMTASVTKKTLELRREIEQKERAEAETGRLAEHKLLLGALVDSSHDAIVVKSLDGTITSWNPAAAKLYGFSPGEAVGRSAKLIVPDERREEHDKLLDRVSHGEGVELIETVRKTKSGRRIDVSLTFSPVFDAEGKVIAASSIARDITESKRSEEMFRLAIDSSPAGVMIVEADGHIRIANAEARRMFGYEDGHLAGKTVEVLIPEIYRENHPGLRRSYLAEPSARRMGGGRELSGLKRDGTEFPLEIGLNPVRTRDGILVMAVIIDVTEEKKLAEQLRQAQKMEAIGQLAGGVAHDFNNLLTVINGYAELLLSEEFSGDAARGMLQEIQRSGERAASLTGQLLAFSRKSVMKPGAIRLNDAITGVENLLMRLIGEDIQLTTSLEPDPGYVLADPNQMEQVIMNLAVNARDAMPEGGHLAIQTRKVRLGEPGTTLESDLVPGDYIMLSVSDTGIGMDEATRRQIFEPFFTTKGVGKGTGLGLATVYGVVKQSGGQITVYSEPGVGSTFKIYLPEIDKSAVPAVRELAAPETYTGSETILLAEDEDGLRGYVRLVLETRGYRVLEGSTAGAALQRATAHEAAIDLLLTDVVMPGMSGRELADRLQALRPQMRVLYMSGYTDDAVLRRGILRTEIAFLEKPFTSTRLLQAVRFALDDTPGA